MTTEPVGLRERKRLATRRTIQLAVLALIAEKGFEKVTVEDISARADVSSRTFFNYFPSKDAAAIGDAPNLPDESHQQAFVDAGPGSDLIMGLARLLVHAVEEQAGDVEMLQERRRLLKEYPQLFSMRMATMRVFEEQITALISRRLAHDDLELAADPVALEDRARLVTYVSFGALRHAWAAWADGEGRVVLSERTIQSFEELSALLGPMQPV